MLKLIKEEQIKPIAIDEISTPDAPAAESEIPEAVVVNACQDLINGLTQAAWEFISSVNSAIATIEYDFKNEETKSEIIELLNTIVDDSTINIGVLHKVFSLINGEKSDLIASGEEKAENIISSSEVEEIEQ